MSWTRGRRDADGYSASGVRWKEVVGFWGRIAVTIDSDKDLRGLRGVGRVVALARDEMRRAVEPGVSTQELDRIGADVSERHGARSSPNLVYGFPGTNRISLNDEAFHGIPSPERTIRPGDPAKIDVTAELGGYMADSAV